MYKKIFSVFVMLSFLATSMPAESAPFGRSKSSSSSKYKPSKSYSSSKSSNSYKNTTSKRAERSQGGLSGGNSLGMSRSRVTDSVRDGSYKNNMANRNNTNNNSSLNNSSTSNSSYNRSNNNTYNNSTNNRNYNDGYARGYNSGYNNRNNNYNRGYNNNGYRNNNRYGTKALIGAVVAGALIGYILFQDDNGNSYFANPSNPNMAYDANANLLPSVPVGNYSQVGAVNSNGVVESFVGTTTMNGNNTSLNSGLGVPNYSNVSNSPNSSSGVFSSTSSGMLSFLFWMLVLGGIGVGLYFMMRKKKNTTNHGKLENSLGNIPNDNSQNRNKSTPDFFNQGTATQVNNGSNYMANKMNGFKTPEEKILDEKDQFFVDFQKHNKPSQIGFIMSKTDPMLQDAIRESVESSDENRTILVQQLESELVDMTKEGTTYIASVLYRGVVVEDNQETKVNEVWHYKYIDEEWKLAGIEQV